MGNWWQRRRRRQAEQEAARQRLLDECQEKIELRDPEVLDTSRDWADNDAAPWRLEVSMGLGFLVLFVIVPVLIAFFMGIKALAGK